MLLGFQIDRLDLQIILIFTIFANDSQIRPGLEHRQTAAKRPKLANPEEKVEYKTQARQMIMDYMAENPDRIFKASGIAQSIPEVSLSTIYRNLSRLEKAGVIQIVGADDNNELQYRYTGPGRCEEKMHLVCKECGKFFHLEGPALKVLQLSVQRTGFELDQQQSVLLGRCSGCSRRRHD